MGGALTVRFKNDVKISSLLPTRNKLTLNQANGCEDGTTGGFVAYNSTITVGTSVPYQGSYYITSHTNNTGGNEGISQSGFTAGLKSNTTYTLTAYIRGSVGGEQVYLKMSELLIDGSPGVGFKKTNITLTTGWQRGTVTRTFGATGRASSFAIYTQLQQHIDFQVDGLQLEEGAVATPWQAPI
jgi:hypothetical protein